MKKIFLYLSISFMVTACNNSPTPGNTSPGDTSSATAGPSGTPPTFRKGQFGYDLEFLQKHDDVIVLEDGEARVVVSPKYQAKVFTSTAEGSMGKSFGWINYKAFGEVNAHMNGYGGENRLWLGPEGGKFSLFFKPGSKMVFDNWKTPSPFDTEPWEVTTKTGRNISLHKEMKLISYAGTELTLSIDRSIKILSLQEIITQTGSTPGDSIKVVGYETDNILTNKGPQPWTETTGMPCIWILDMFPPSPATVIAVPFKAPKNLPFNKVATTNYFGEIPSDRIKHDDNILFFKADGNSRGKLGIAPHSARHLAGSYDAQNKILTVIIFDIDTNAKYLNQEWNTVKPPFSGDAVNAYNDGPLADGSQMGPFYEIESVSPAAFLQPNQSLSHKHSVFHFTGDEKALDKISLHLFGAPIEKIKTTFSNEKTK